MTALRGGVPWLGMPIADVGALDRALVDRQLPAQGPSAARASAAPGGEERRADLVAAFGRRRLADARSRIARSSRRRSCRRCSRRSSSRRRRARARTCPRRLQGIEPAAAADVIAASLLSGERRAILLGNYAIQHPRRVADRRARAGARVDHRRDARRAAPRRRTRVGGYLAGALPQKDGLNAQAMLGTEGAESRRAYVVLHAEPEFDCANPVAARAALEKADLVVVLSAFRTATRYADVLLPIAPFTETSGTFVNCEGRAQRFHGVVQPAGRGAPRMEGAARARHDARTAGIRVRQLRAGSRRRARPRRATLDGKLSNATTRRASSRPAKAAGGVERVADVPIHFADPLVRRAAVVAGDSRCEAAEGAAASDAARSARARPKARRSRSARVAARRCLQRRSIRRAAGCRASNTTSRGTTEPGDIALAALDCRDYGHHVEPGRATRHNARLVTRASRSASCDIVHPTAFPQQQQHVRTKQTTLLVSRAARSAAPGALLPPEMGAAARCRLLSHAPARIRCGSVDHWHRRQSRPTLARR